MNRTRVSTAVLALCLATLATPASQASLPQIMAAPLAEHELQAGVTYGQTVEALTFAKTKCSTRQLQLTPKKCRKAPTAAVEAHPDAEPAAPPAPVKGQPVTPGYAPAGNPAAFNVKQSEFGEPHWDYCKPFTYKINPAGMSDAFKADMNEALARFSAASGLQFVYGGETDLTPYQTRDWFVQADKTQQTLIIAILDEARVPELAGDVAGIGGAAWMHYGSGAPRFYVSAVVIDGEAQIGPGFGPDQGGPLLLHELGHVAGLLHVPDSDQIMHPLLLPDGPTNYQAGDLAGLAHLAANDCFS